MKNYNAKDVDSYIAGSGSDARPKLEEIRKIIKSAVPKAEEGISWGVPFYKYHGVLAGFAAFKNHAGVWFPAVMLRSKDRKMLEKKGYVTGKKIIQIKFGQKVPAAFIKQILKEQAKMNAGKKALMIRNNSDKSQ